MSTVIPTLGPMGYIKSNESPSDLIQQQFALGFVTDYSQSTVFTTDVFSFQWYVKEYGDDPQDLCNRLGAAYQDMYKRHFDSVSVNCTYKAQTVVDYTVNLDITITHEGTTHQLGRELLVNPTASTTSVLSALNR